MKNLGMYHPWIAATLSQTLEKLPSSHFIDSLSALEKRGTDLLVLASEDDLTPRPRTPFLRSIDIRRIGKKKSYEVQFVSGADHGLHNAEGRNRAMTILDAHILAHFASTAQLSANSDNEL
jgi:hypothetical protein